MESGIVEELEKRIEKLIERYAELKGENERLSGVIKSKDEEIEDLARRLEKLGREKGLVRERVENLLQKLEGLMQTA